MQQDLNESMPQKPSTSPISSRCQARHKSKQNEFPNNSNFRDRIVDFQAEQTIDSLLLEIKQLKTSLWQNISEKKPQIQQPSVDDNKTWKKNKICKQKLLQFKVSKKISDANSKSMNRSLVTITPTRVTRSEPFNLLGQHNCIDLRPQSEMMTNHQHIGNKLNGQGCLKQDLKQHNDFKNSISPLSHLPLKELEIRNFNNQTNQSNQQAIQLIESDDIISKELQTSLLKLKGLNNRHKSDITYPGDDDFSRRTSLVNSQYKKYTQERKIF